MTALAKTRSVLIAAVIALAITAYGQGLWGVLVYANLNTRPAIPWAPALMVPMLAVMVLFLAGVWPRKGASARRRLIRLGPVSRRAFLWSILAGGCGVAALSGLWIVLASLVKTLPNLLIDIKGVPVSTLAPILIVSILAAPITEEIAFRGYALGLLERTFTPTTAIVVSSILFALAHLTQGLYPTKLIVYFLAGLAFALIAWRTGSLLPAMIVHSLADLTFFTLVWPHDGARRLVSEGGAGPWFWIHVGQIAVFGALGCLAFRRLFAVTGQNLERDRPMAGAQPALA